jgi:hypothetical protein
MNHLRRFFFRYRFLVRFRRTSFNFRFIIFISISFNIRCSFIWFNRSHRRFTPIRFHWINWWIITKFFPNRCSNTNFRIQYKKLIILNVILIFLNLKILFHHLNIWIYLFFISIVHYHFKFVDLLRASTSITNFQ